jgi:hypothetical protein
VILSASRGYCARELADDNEDGNVAQQNEKKAVYQARGAAAVQISMSCEVVSRRVLLLETN